MWAATLLWRTSVPHVELPRLDARAVFGAELVRRAGHYEGFFRVDWVLLVAAQLGALAAVAVRARRLRLGLGRVGSGVVLTALAVTAAWSGALPFELTALWWRRRHGIVHETYASFLAGRLTELLATAAAALLAVTVALALAAVLGRRWWLAGAPLAAAAALAFTFAAGYLSGGDPARPALRAEERVLAAREGVSPPPLRVTPAPGGSRAANAGAIGIGPSRRIVLWRTLLQRPFSPREVRFVLAHELTHHRRRHLWKGVAWFALLALPVTALLAYAVDLRRPGAVPLALLVLSVAQLALLPLENAISRRYEAEADWQGLRATRDPAAARALFVDFARTGLEDPDPPGWDDAWLETHPTLLQRVELAAAWRSFSRPASPEGS